MKKSLLLIAFFVAMPIFSVQAKEVIGIRHASMLGQLALIGTHAERCIGLFPR